MFLSERKHYGNVLSLEQIVVARYSLESSPGPVDNYRYKQSITGNIVRLDDTDKSKRKSAVSILTTSYSAPAERRL